MKNLKINAKLIISFGVVLAVLLGLSLVSFNSVNKMNGIISEYKDATLPNTNLSLSIQRNLFSFQKNVLTAIIDENPAVIAEAVKKAEDNFNEMLTFVESYKHTFTGDKALLDKIVAITEQNQSIEQQIVELSSKNLAETNKQAYVLYASEFAPNNEMIADILNDIVIQQENLAVEQSKSASSTALFSYIVLVIGVVLSFVITFILIILLRNSIVKPIIELGKKAVDISNGNLHVNLMSTSKDEIGMLTDTFINVRDTFILLLEKIEETAENFKMGEINARLPEDQFVGEYKNAVNAINSTVEGLINDTLVILDSFGQLGEGNFTVEMPQFPGKKADSNVKFNAVKGNLAAVNSDITKLIEGAINGQLDVRVNTESYRNDWKKLTEGLNSLLLSVSKPIDEANKVLDSLSQGIFDIKVENNFKGSFASMMNSFEKMVVSTGSYINEITEVLSTIASGDLTRDISREYIGQFNLIKNSINNISKTLRTTIYDIKISADNVLAGAKQITESAMTLAEGASSQAASIEELNASILNINEQTNRNADKAQNAEEFSKKSIESARNGNNEMTNMLNSMEDIKEASRNISKIIKVIDDIAFQTNLLALNAAVEAARAGQYGKGFAVVAEEVRSLASRSQKAAKETSELIENTIAKVNKGTEIAELTAGSLEAIVTNANAVSEIIDDIYFSTKEQVDAIGQITIGINQISDVVQTNSSTSEESAAAAQELNSQSEVLAQMVSHFKV